MPIIVALMSIGEYGAVDSRTMAVESDERSEFFYMGRRQSL